MTWDANSFLLYGLGLLLVFLVQNGLSKQGIRLARLERKVDALLKKSDVDHNADVDPEVLELVKAGRKPEAIKKFQETTGAGLREAAEFIEQLS